MEPEWEFKLKGCNFVFNNFCECVKSYCENGNECEGFNFYHLFSFVTCNFQHFQTSFQLYVVILFAIFFLKFLIRKIHSFTLNTITDIEHILKFGMGT